MPSMRHLSQDEGFGASIRQMLGIWTFGPYSTLNVDARWQTTPMNLLMDTADMEGAAWAGDAVATSATVVTFDTDYSEIRQQISTSNDVEYTLAAEVAHLTGNTDTYYLYHGSIGTTRTHMGTITSTPTWYAVTITGNGAGGWFGIEDYTTDDGDSVAITKMALLPGTYTAAEAAAAYETVGADRQEIWDWSGNTNHLQVGSAAGSDTNDASHLVESYNLAIAGTTEDLEHASWSYTNASAGSATEWTPSAQDGQVVQQFTGINGSVYIVSAIISSVGNTSLEWTLDGIETSVTVTGTDTRYNIEYTGDGAAANIGLRDPNAGGFGAITTTEFQIERAPTGSDPLPYQSGAEPVFSCTHCDYDGVDNYGDLNALALSGDWSFLALFRADDVTGRGLWRDGTSNPDISVDASSKMSYSAGSTIVATNAIAGELWYVIGITNSGGTITHYLDGVANGSGSSAGNTFSALRLGYDGVNYFDGAILMFVADDSAWLASEILSNTCDIAAMAWDYRAVPSYGPDSACSEYDLTVAPKYAYLSPAEWLEHIRQQAFRPVVAALLPRLEVIQ